MTYIAEGFITNEMLNNCPRAEDEAMEIGRLVARVISDTRTLPSHVVLILPMGDGVTVKAISQVEDERWLRTDEGQGFFSTLGRIVTRHRREQA